MREFLKSIRDLVSYTKNRNNNTFADIVFNHGDIHMASAIEKEGEIATNLNIEVRGGAEDVDKKIRAIITILDQKQ